MNARVFKMGMLCTILWFASGLLSGNPPSSYQTGAAPNSMVPNVPQTQPVDRRELDLAVRELRTDMAAQRNDFFGKIQEYETLKWFIFFVLGTTLASFFNVWGKIIDWRLAKIFDRKAHLIQEMLEKQDEERQFQHKLKLLLISDREPSTTTRLLAGHQFRNIHLKTFPSGWELDAKRFSDFEEDQFDLIVFDNLDARRIDAFTEHSGKKVFVAYSAVPDRQMVRHQEKINFANSPMTLYSRVVEAARYQKALER